MLRGLAGLRGLPGIEAVAEHDAEGAIATIELHGSDSAD